MSGVLLVIAGFRGNIRTAIGELGWFQELVTNPERALEDLGPSGGGATKGDLEQAKKELLDAIAKQGQAQEAEGKAPPPDAEAAAAARSAAEAVLAEGTKAERQALKQIGEGETGKGLDALFEAAEPATDALLTRWRNIAQIAYPLDTGRAIKAYEKVAALGSKEPWDAIYLGRLYVQAGDLDKARGVFGAALAALPNEQERNHSVLFNDLGDVRQAQGDLAGALESYRASLGIREKLAAQDPGNAGWQRDLSVSHDRIGNVRRAQGDLAGALESYRADLAIAEKLAAQDPGNAGWQRDLSVSHNKIGELRQAQGDLAGALESYRADLAIAEKLASQDPGNAGWQRDLSVSHEKIGDVRQAQGDLAGALESYKSSFELMLPLLVKDPGNTLWQRDLSVSHEKIGEVRQAQGDLAGALESYRASLAIREKLAAQDPGNAEWQRDLAVSYWRLAGMAGSGVTWRQVANAWQAMEDRSVLFPPDRWILAEAKRRAEMEAKE